jgi:maleylacetoacetate isomerase
LATLKLYDFWRSGAAYRTRIALNLKGLTYESEPVNLRAMAQRSPEYLKVNPQGLTPALVVDGRVLTQSLAILEWLEETYPAPALLPRDPWDRSVVRAMADLVACDVHPLNNVRVLRALKQDFGADEPQLNHWARRWIAAGFDALEVMIERCGGSHAFGDRPSFADCALMPQVYSADRFAVDMTAYPRISQVARNCSALKAFADAHPDLRPDAVLTP